MVVGLMLAVGVFFAKDVANTVRNVAQTVKAIFAAIM
jgi:hypothetical protein